MVALRATAAPEAVAAMPKANKSAATAAARRLLRNEVLTANNSAACGKFAGFGRALPAPGCDRYGLALAQVGPHRNRGAHSHN